VKTLKRPLGSGAAVDYYGIWFHGLTSTHIDALCHTWDETGLYNGRDPAEHIGPDGSTWGSVANWKDGIITRGVLLDVPRSRGEPYVTMDRPVMGSELAALADASGISFEPGDAVVVHSGREAWDADTRNPPYGSIEERPGLHASCIEFLRDIDCSMIVWDMMDLTPSGFEMPWAVHGIQIAYGVALLDNALIEPVAEVCADLGRHDFMLTVAPLNVAGGTGSPVNPIAVF
jgi:kynurenine formamidase